MIDAQRPLLHEVAFFIALLATALALGGAMAHALELPNKIGVSREHYFIMQRAYDGWFRLAYLLVAQLAGILAVIFILSRRFVGPVAGTRRPGLSGRRPGGLLDLDLSGQPGHQQLDRAARELGNPAPSLGIFTPCRGGISDPGNGISHHRCVEATSEPPWRVNESEVLMKTQYFTVASLDGFIATLDDSLKWLFPLGRIDDTSYPIFIRDVGALAMGSTTYEWMLRHLLGSEADRPQPWPYGQPAWVFSTRTLPPVPDADIRFVRGDVRSVHREMVAVAGGKNVWIVGGGELAGQFYDCGLLDELFVQVGSVVLGEGKPLLLRAITDPPLRLISAKAVGSGFAELHYEVPRPR